MISIWNIGIKFHVLIVKELKIWYIGFVLEMPRAFNKGEHPVLSYVQLRIYKISKNVAGPNIEFVSKDKTLKCSMFNFLEMGWLSMSRRNESEREWWWPALSQIDPFSSNKCTLFSSNNKCTSHFGKTLKTSRISVQLWMKNPRLV